MNGHSQTIQVLLSVFLSLMLTGCRESVEYSDLLVRELNQVNRGRTIVSRSRVRRLEPLFEITRPADADWPFRLSKPQKLAVSARHKTLAVTDPIDRAVHLFDWDGSYISTVYVGGRDERRLDALTSVTIDSLGVLVLVDGVGRRVIRVRTDGFVLDDISIAAINDQERSVAMAVSYDRIFESTMSLPGNAQTPVLMRVLTRQGNLLGSIGSKILSANPELIPALNLGSLVVDGDTVWHARHFDGRISGFHAQPGTSEPDRVIEIPLFFQTGPPKQVLSDSLDRVYPTATGNHTAAMAVDPTGSFVLAQSFGRGRGWGVSVLSRDGGEYAVFDVGGEIAAVVATQDRIYVIVSTRDLEGGTHRRHIKVYPHPLYKGQLGVDEGTQ